MTGVPWWSYLVVGAGSALLVVLLTPVARRAAVRVGAFDRPGGYKQQAAPVPYLGGAAIVVAFAVVLALITLLSPRINVREPAIIFGLAAGLAVVGLLDDLHGLGPWTRLAYQTAAAVAVIATGVRVDLVGNVAVDVVVTVLWVVGVTNAFNLLDNMDGLSAGVTAVAAGSFFLIAALNGQFLVASLAAALSGVAAGFVWHNFHPATIYMGDSGSLFFGFLLSVLGLKLRFEGPREITFFVPVLVVGVALLDTLLVVTTRLRAGRSPLSGGRDHVSHRLVALGLTVPTAVKTIYAAAVSLGWLALVMSRIDRTSGFILMGYLLVAGAGALVLLARVGVPAVEERHKST